MSEPTREHEWFYPETGAYMAFPFCRVCGVVQRRDGKDRPCKGPTKLREFEKPIPEVTR